MENKTLLQKAKQIRSEGKTKGITINITHEHIELAIAWAKGEIRLSEISQVIPIHSRNLYPFLAFALREHIKKTNA